MKTKTTFLACIMALISVVAYSQACVDFETLVLGTEYGDGFNAQGEVILVENDIPVSVEYFEWSTGGTFGTATVIDGSATIGTGNSMWTSNINLKFDFSGIGYQPNYVSFDYTDGGGHENISLNGMPIYVGDIDTWIPPPGYAMGIVNMGTYDHILIIGMNPILELIVGGQEFSLDNICYGIMDEFPECIDFIMVPQGAVFGDGYNTMGEVIFIEDDIPVSVEWFEYSTGGTFGNCWGIDGNPIYGDDVAMWTSNINLKIDLSTTYPASTFISFDYTDYGGHENIGLNGNPIYAGELSSAVLPPGFSISIVVMADYNHAEITANTIITELVIGGQEFTIDNICPGYNVSIDDFDKSSNKVNMGQNYPNPFNGTTIIPFTVKEKTQVVIAIYNQLGQQVSLLTDAVYNVGDHILEWNSAGISEGLYFYQLRTPGFMQTRKLTVY